MNPWAWLNGPAPWPEHGSWIEWGVIVCTVLALGLTVVNRRRQFERRRNYRASPLYTAAGDEDVRRKAQRQTERLMRLPVWVAVSVAGLLTPAPGAPEFELRNVVIQLAALWAIFWDTFPAYRDLRSQQKVDRLVHEQHGAAGPLGAAGDPSGQMDEPWNLPLP